MIKFALVILCVLLSSQRLQAQTYDLLGYTETGQPVYQFYGVQTFIGTDGRVQYLNPDTGVVTDRQDVAMNWSKQATELANRQATWQEQRLGTGEAADPSLEPAPVTSDDYWAARQKAVRSRYGTPTPESIADARARNDMVGRRPTLPYADRAALVAERGIAAAQARDMRLGKASPELESSYYLARSPEENAKIMAEQARAEGYVGAAREEAESRQRLLESMQGMVPDAGAGLPQGSPTDILRPDKVPAARVGQSSLDSVELFAPLVVISVLFLVFIVVLLVEASQPVSPSSGVNESANAPVPKSRCPACGISVFSDATVCGRCGCTLQPLAAEAPSAAVHAGSGAQENADQRTTSGMAIAGFCLGIASVFFYWIGIVPLLGLVFSIMALANYQPELHKNRWMAITGLVLSALYMLMCLFAYAHVT